MTCQGRHALALTPTLPSLGHRKGPSTILRLLLFMLLLLLFVFVLLIKREVERRRERAIGTVLIENGVHGVLRDNTKRNRWPARRDNGNGGLTGNPSDGKLEWRQTSGKKYMAWREHGNVYAYVLTAATMT